MEIKEVKDAFNDIQAPASLLGGSSSYLGNGYWSGSNTGGVDLNNLFSLNLGAGNNAIKMDSEQGIWLGGNQFNEARTRIDTKGNYIFKDSEGVDRILIGEN